MENVIIVHRGRNQDVSLESSSIVTSLVNVYVV